MGIEDFLICPSCKAKNDSEFVICWKCSTELHKSQRDESFDGTPDEKPLTAKEVVLDYENLLSERGSQMGRTALPESILPYSSEVIKKAILKILLETAKEEKELIEHLKVIFLRLAHFIDDKEAADFNHEERMQQIYERRNVNFPPDLRIANELSLRFKDDPGWYEKIAERIGCLKNRYHDEFQNALALTINASNKNGESNVDLRRFIPEEVKRSVWRRDEGKCVKCGNRERLEFDHIIPISKGGSSTARNVELLCEKCNREKSDSV